MNDLRVRLKGALNADTGRKMFTAIQRAIRRGRSSIILDLKDTGRLDSMGGAWVLRLKHMAMNSGVNLDFVNVPENVQNYLNLILPGLDHLDRQPPAPPIFFESLGDAFFNSVIELHQGWDLFVDVLYWTFVAPFDGRKIRFSSIIDELHEIGVRAVGIIFLMNYLLGFIVAMLSAAQVRQFGAGIYVADLVSIGFARELAPIMTAIILSARSGAAIAAEIATMQVQEEIDALKGMGINVTYYLITPKVLAMLLAMPCLVLIALVAGCWGGLHVGLFILDLDMGQWLNRTVDAVQFNDIFQGLAKSLFFAITIVLVGCHNGLRVTGGARGVGLVTTRSVVMDIFFIVVFDVVFATFFYYIF
ncbi:MAG TPA: ABC transporter permease [Candidatus Sumerlaeota bacterium]|nr:ABC transporter permease [Candidatus Sumerlaeota bacterium]